MRKRTLAERRADKAAATVCCELWPECAHVLAAIEPLLDEREDDARASLRSLEGALPESSKDPAGAVSREGET